MTEQASQTSASYRPPQPPPTKPSGAAVGFTMFAASMMILAGSWQALQGLVALFEDDVFVAVNNYMFEFDLTTWGWIHLICGVLVAMAGFGLFSGRMIARIVGITLAGISAIVNFLSIPYYPFWSMTIIAVNVFVIWALSVHGRDITTDEW